MKTSVSSWLAAISASIALCPFGAQAIASHLPTGPFIDTTLHDGSRNGALATLSADGRYSVYDVDHSYLMADGSNRAIRDVVLFDKQLATVTQISFGDEDSYGATISGDGRYVVFVTSSTKLNFRNTSITAKDVGDTTNAVPHIFIADLRTDRGKASEPVTYDMVDTSTLDQYGCRASAPTTSICIGGDGPAADPFISSDGSHVAYVSSAVNLDSDLPVGATAVDRIYLWDRSTRTARVIAPSANGYAESPTLSGDAKRLAFASTATNLVTPIGNADGGSNIFLWDSETGAYTLASANGIVRGNHSSWSPALSADGSWVAFTTLSDNLDANDTNGEPDVYVYNIPTGKSYGISVVRLLGDCKDAADQLSSSWKICLSATFEPAGGSEPSISADGRYVAFMSAAPLINQIGDTLTCDPVDRNGRLDIYLADMARGGEITLQSMLQDSTGKLWATPAGESRFPTISANGQVISFETSSAAFRVKDFEKIADPLYLGDGLPNALVLDSLQRRPCP